MSELKLKFKDKKDSKEVKQELKKSDPGNPINLIDVYFSLTKRFFKCINIKIRNEENNV